MKNPHECTVPGCTRARRVGRRGNTYQWCDLCSRIFGKLQYLEVFGMIREPGERNDRDTFRNLFREGRR